MTLSYVVNEVIDMYRNENSKLFSCFVDIEKAFDSVWWAGLLYKMSNLGIKHKLWHLFHKWLHGSTCNVMLNGSFSPSFTISRSIKQGGLLSMLMFCISIYDVHTSIIQAPAQGIVYNGEDVSSLTFADDMLVLSSSVIDLQCMLNNLNEYGRKWRIKFSPNKTVCMTFGETKRQHQVNVSKRSMYLGDTKLTEVSHTMYLGNNISAVNNTSTRSKQMSNRAYSYLGNLLSTGFHSLGLSPTTNATLWRRLCIPSMLFGCEVWGDITSNEYEMFEKAQRKVAKHLQGITRRTHNEVALGLLGWHTIRAVIDKCKCMFLCKLVNMNDCITKRVFLHELYISRFKGLDVKTATGDLIRVLHKYDIHNYLHRYSVGSSFPGKIPWKHIVKENISRVENSNWSGGLVRKGALRFHEIHPTLSVHPLYKYLCKDLSLRQQIMNIVKLLTIVEEDEPMLCTACGDILTDSVDHVMMRCRELLVERNIMWDHILDNMNVHSEVRFVAKSDKEAIHILLGKCDPDIDITSKMYMEVGNFISNVIAILGI